MAHIFFLTIFIDLITSLFSPISPLLHLRFTVACQFSWWIDDNAAFITISYLLPLGHEDGRLQCLMAFHAAERIYSLLSLPISRLADEHYRMLSPPERHAYFDSQSAPPIPPQSHIHKNYVRTALIFHLLIRADALKPLHFTQANYLYILCHFWELNSISPAAGHFPDMLFWYYDDISTTFHEPGRIDFASLSL